MKKIISCLFVLVMVAGLGLNASALSIALPYNYKYYVKVAPETSVDDVYLNDAIKYRLATGSEFAQYFASNCYVHLIAVVKGDVDGDGKVNSSDFIKARYSFLGINELTEIEFMAADVNDDGKVNSTDFMQIRKHFLNLYEIYADKAPAYDERIEDWISRLNKNNEYAKNIDLNCTDELDYLCSHDWTETGAESITEHITMLNKNENEQMYVKNWMMSELTHKYTSDIDFINSTIELFGKMKLQEMTEDETANYEENQKCYVDEEGNFCNKEEGTEGNYGTVEADFKFVGKSQFDGFFIRFVRNNPDIYKGDIVVTCLGKNYKITNIDEISDELYDFLAIVEIAF